jgi:digalactosyldiacylglycerol synthase
MDLLAPHTAIAVVSTAAIPWMTGTAVNPTLRAAFLARHPSTGGAPPPAVTLAIPWLPPADQAALFPAATTFATPAHQAAAIRAWVAARAGFTPDFGIQFYPGRYDRTLLGVFPVGDLASRVCFPGPATAGWHPPPAGATGCGGGGGQPALLLPLHPHHKLAHPPTPHTVILEEPEHLTWFHAGPRWTACGPVVLGVVHTNYRELAARNAGPSMRLVAGAACRWLTGAHTDVAIKLSATIQRLSREVVCCVHGVAPAFLAEGAARAAAAAAGAPLPFTAGGYALGKVVWGKGWEELVDLLGGGGGAGGGGEAIHAYGDGDALPAVQAAAAACGAPLAWHAKADHVAPALKPYRAFVNASTSDVVATTSLEALAMGKWLVCAAHPCNAWACTFSNALPYRTRAEFRAALAVALATDPAPLPPGELRALGWEAAIERLAACARGPVEGGGGEMDPYAGAGRAAARRRRKVAPSGGGKGVEGGGGATAGGGGPTPTPATPSLPRTPSVRALRRRASWAAEAAFAAVYRAALSVEAVRVAACAGAGTAGKHPTSLDQDGLTYRPPAPAASSGRADDSASSCTEPGRPTFLGAAFLAIAAAQPAVRVRVRVGGGRVALWSAGAGVVGGGGLARPSPAPPFEGGGGCEDGASAPAPHHGYAYGGLSAPWEL